MQAKGLMRAHKMVAAAPNAAMCAAGPVRDGAADEHMDRPRQFRVQQDRGHGVAFRSLHAGSGADRRRVHRRHGSRGVRPSSQWPYLIIVGRVYCCRVCPVDIVTDTARWLHEGLRLRRGRKLDRRTRVHRAAREASGIFRHRHDRLEICEPGQPAAACPDPGYRVWLDDHPDGIPAGSARFPTDMVQPSWPRGRILRNDRKGSPVRVVAVRREACTNCGVLFNRCPEPHVIVPALKEKESPLILSGDCINCGVCIDARPVDVFRMSSRFHATR